MRESPPAQVAVQRQPLAAPRGSVRAPPGAVQGDAEAPFAGLGEAAVLRQHRCGVGQVVLHRHQLRPTPIGDFTRHPAARVIRMLISCYHLRRDLEKVEEAIDDLTQKLSRGGGVEIADVL